MVAQDSYQIIKRAVTPVTWENPHSKLLISVFPENGAPYRLQ